MSSDLPSLEDLEGKRFIFFPLSTEPESLQTLSPEYFYQLAFITSIARDLPVGVYLVVKEHSLPCRPPAKNFLRPNHGIQECDNGEYSRRWSRLNEAV